VPHHRKFAVLAAALLTGLGLVAAPAPAMAASCRASGCDGKDPQAEGCSPGAITLDDKYDGGYHLELRYSSACHAAWVRANSQGYWSQTGDFRLLRQSPSSLFRVTFGGGESGQKWTRMYSFQYRVAGRLIVTNTSTGHKSDQMTPWY
jgi:hypothetical protein